MTVRPNPKRIGRRKLRVSLDTILRVASLGSDHNTMSLTSNELNKAVILGWVVIRKNGADLKPTLTNKFRDFLSSHVPNSLEVFD